MDIIDRWEKIRELLKNEKSMSADQISEKLGVSPATIRRDFVAMEKKGLLTRFHGGVRLNNIQHQLVNTMTTRVTDNEEIKKAIAKKAVSLIRDGDYIFLDASSTVYYMVDFIDAEGITVVTNCYNLVPKLIEKGISCYITAGTPEESGAIWGPDTFSKLATMNFNVSFIGAYGITSQNGFTTYNQNDALLKRTIIDHSELVYTLVDSSKFFKKAFHSYASANETIIITDSLNEENSRFQNLIIAD